MVDKTKLITEAQLLDLAPRALQSCHCCHCERSEAISLQMCNAARLLRRYAPRNDTNQ